MDGISRVCCTEEAAAGDGISVGGGQGGWCPRVATVQTVWPLTAEAASFDTLHHGVQSQAATRHNRCSVRGRVAIHSSSYHPSPITTRLSPISILSTVPLHLPPVLVPLP